jgi:hypothetical protein
MSESVTIWQGALRAIYPGAGMTRREARSASL